VPWLTIAQVAALALVDHKTIRRMIERREMPAKCFGQVWRVNPAWLDAPYAPRARASPRPAPSGRVPRQEHSRLARDP
jgi:excisionase family DNA binding protein